MSLRKNAKLSSASWRISASCSNITRGSSMVRSAEVKWLDQNSTMRSVSGESVVIISW